MKQHRGVLSALEGAFPVGFEPIGNRAAPDLDAVLCVDGSEPEEMPAGLPSLVFGPRRPPSDRSEPIDFAGGASVPRPLRGKRLASQALLGQRWRVPGGSDRILATAASGPVWWERGREERPTQVSAFPLPHPGPNETLRDHLRPGRFMGLLPLLQLLRRVSGESLPKQPLRACFVIDDPNLHWPSYGRLDYHRLIEHGRDGGYHTALGTVPLDGWLVNQRAAALLRANRAHVSLAIHGNDHTGHELGSLLEDRAAERVMAQALRRVRALERRSGVSVDRVMVPPHERCSEQSLRAMLRLGFEAACISRPHPWRDAEPAATVLLGWRPAELVAGGLPVLPRHALALPSEELVFRALLGQPLIVYGHEHDLADGLEVLDRAADFISGLGTVQWGPLSWIARTNFTLTRAGQTLLSRLHTGRALIEVPSGVRELRAEVPEMFGEPGWRGVRAAGHAAALRPSGRGWVSDPIPVRGPETVVLELVRAGPLEEAHVQRPPRRVWPLVRRVVVEQRDRLGAVGAAVSVGSKRGARRVTMLLQNNPYPQDTRVRNEAEELVSDGRHVTVIAPRSQGQPATEWVAGVRVRRFRCPTSGGSLSSYLFEYAVAHLQLFSRGMVELLGGADVVHAHGPPDTLALLGAVARLAGRASVFDLHDSSPELFAAKFGSSRLRPVLEVTQRVAVKSASRVIVTNESQRELVRSRSGRSGTRVVVVRNGPRGAEFGTPPPGRPGVLLDARLIYVGALDVQDGVLDLADVLSMPCLSGAHLTVVGDGPLAEGLHARCNAAGLAGRVTMTGRVPHDRIPTLIAAADIGIDPAPGTELNHGSTMIKITEYLAAGRPVVAYALRETQRTAGDAALYASCGEPRAFAELIACLAADPGRRAELARTARERSAELMWERSAGVLRGVYASLD